MLAMDDMKMVENNGPSTEPCGTPMETTLEADDCIPTFTVCDRPSW